MPLLSRRRSALDLPKADLPHPPRTANGGSEKTAPSGLLSPSRPPSPVRPATENGYPALSRLSHEVQPDEISDVEQTREGKKLKRFSMMRLRNYSESHLAARAKMDMEKLGEQLPPVPSVTAEGSVPSIVRTAPTMDVDQINQTAEEKSEETAEASEEEEMRDERKVRPSLFQRASSRRRPAPQMPKSARKSMDEQRDDKSKGGSFRWRRGKNDGLADLHRMSMMHINNNNNQPPTPPSYGDESNSALAIPVDQLAHPRFSESSRSDMSNGSSGDGHVYGSTTTTTHTVSTHTTFFKLPRRNKNRNSLFPLPVRIPAPEQTDTLQDEDGPTTPRASTSASVSNTPEPQPTPDTVQQSLGTLQRRHTESSPTKHRLSRVDSPSLAKSSLSFAEPNSNLFRASSQRSKGSATSSPLHPPNFFGMRNRSSTTSSFGRASQDVETPPPLSASGRNSTSTNGRSSFGGLLTLGRFRQGSEPHSPRRGSPGPNSKSNSFAMSREALVVPEREEGDTPGKYLERLEAAVSRSLIAGILSKSADPFAQAVLRSYTRRFMFFGEPIDMSLRKFLLEAELPKETQQVDRVVQAFADRYHECNPGIFTAPDQAYIIAFSIMMLHTDAFNKNNKRKMQKQDYIKNTSGQGVSDDILACFYDNICYTPFVHYEEEVDINGQKVLPFQPKKQTAKLKSAIPGSEVVGKKASGPLDPYNLLVDQKLDQLRPSLKETNTTDDPYNYVGSQGELNVQYLQKAFTHTGILQIISARSRPAAYESQGANGSQDPTETQQGIVDLKITKVGIVWRKSTKKKKTRSPWQEWGAVLTGSQLYLFKNAHWAKGLVNQFQSAQKPGRPRTPVVFKPPLHDFKPDALIKTDDAVALVDATYTRHKHAFTFVRPGGQEEIFLAESELELNDWLGLINYAAAFRAAGVRIRGMLGGNEEEARPKGEGDSADSGRLVQTTMGEVKLQNRGLTPQLQKQVMVARRQIMAQKISELEKGASEAIRQLENMLRNTRHLQVLAPIPPKTRDDVIHAAARADAMTKWLRRDIWRMKCHRDILAMDVRLDGLSAGELEKLATDFAQQQADQESASKKEKPNVMNRLSSTKVNTTKSPPRSPTTVTANRGSMTGSMEDTFDGDVFRTPPESVSPTTDEPWRLPPLKLETGPEQHRPSVSGTLLSASSIGGRTSPSYASSVSSTLQVQRSDSVAVSDTSRNGRITPVHSMEERELQLLARSTMTPPSTASPARGFGSGDGPSHSTPESSRPKGVRKSLQKTLRDAQHHHPHHHRHSSVHKHRRGKESDSTVRSGGHDEKDMEVSTPVLARDKPRFILHGKQASVVQFGGDWGRMKQRRDNYGKSGTGSPTQGERDAAFERRRSEQHELIRAGMASPIVQEFAREGGTSDEEDSMSMLSGRTPSFREDAEAAAAYAMEGPSASPTRLSSFSGSDGEEYFAAPSPNFDLSYWDPEQNKRQTIIGPAERSSAGHAAARSQQHHHRTSSLVKGEDGTVRLVDESDTYDSDNDHDGPFAHHHARNNRRTIIGPSLQANGGESSLGKTEKRAGGSPSMTAKKLQQHQRQLSGSVTAGAAAEDADGDEHVTVPISDEELRQLSQRAVHA